MKIRVGGVPEHFNYPWKKAIENNLFKVQQQEVTWLDCPSGTGQMMQLLENDELDLVITLTEGTVNKCNQNFDIEIIQQYVSSPLCWGIHTGKLNNESIKENPTFLISRLGSGSHLMAYLVADKLNIERQNLKFEIINNLVGANEYFEINAKGFFLWEKATTKPMVENGNMKLIDEIETPWPCFVIASRKKFIEDHSLDIEKVLKIVFDTCREIEKNSDSCNDIAHYYHLDLNDVKNWYEKLQWSNFGDKLPDSTKNQVNQILTLI